MDSSEVMLIWGTEIKMEEKKKRWIVFALWLLFILMVAGISYISFQNGEETKEIGKGTIAQLTKMKNHQGAVTQEQLDKVTYFIRQWGRAIAFLMIGIVGTVTIHVTFIKCSWAIRSGIAIFILAVIAYLTEKLKIYIPTRHYSFEEMMISMAAVGVGFVSVSVIIFLGRLLKGTTRPKAASHYSRQQ